MLISLFYLCPKNDLNRVPEIKRLGTGSQRVWLYLFRNFVLQLTIFFHQLLLMYYILRWISLRVSYILIRHTMNLDTSVHHISFVFLLLSVWNVISTGYAPLLLFTLDIPRTLHPNHCKRKKLMSYSYPRKYTKKYWMYITFVGKHI